MLCNHFRVADRAGTRGTSAIDGLIRQVRRGAYGT
jgi:hypothetical protein